MSSNWVFDIANELIVLGLTESQVDSVIITVEKHCPFKRGVSYQEVPKKRQHVWQFYANGSFCSHCGAAIGTSYDCTP